MEWVRDFIKLASKALQSSERQINLLKREFESSANGIYAQVMTDLVNTEQREEEISILND